MTELNQVDQSIFKKYLLEVEEQQRLAEEEARLAPRKNFFKYGFEVGFTEAQLTFMWNFLANQNDGFLRW